MEKEKMVIYKKTTDREHDDVKTENIAIIYEDYSHIAYDVLNKMIDSVEGEANVEIKVIDHMDITQLEIEEMVKQYPNDLELGRAIRQRIKFKN